MNIFILQACNKEFSGRICGKKIIENKCQRCGSEVEYQIKMMSRVCLERPIIFHIKCNNFYRFTFVTIRVHPLWLHSSMMCLRRFFLQRLKNSTRQMKKWKNPYYRRYKYLNIFFIFFSGYLQAVWIQD